ncbi:MAG: class C sortase [Clostridium sp.]
MKKKLSNIGLVLIFVVGFIILIYPKLSNYYNSLVSSHSIGEYDEEVKKVKEVDLNSIFERAEEYNKELIKNKATIKVGESKDKNYLSQLKVKEDEQIIGYITIDKINVRLPIYHGTEESVLQSGVGHLEGTSLPTGGIGMHTVLTGHTGLPSAELFSKLENLEIGDVFVVKVLDRTLAYKVKEKNVVLPKEVKGVKPQEGKDLMTLVTCTPYGVNSHRLLVTGERTDLEPEAEMELTENKVKLSKKDTLILGLIIFIVIIVICFIVRKLIKRNKRGRLNES